MAEACVGSDCSGGTGAAGAAGGNNLGLSGPVDGGNSCEQNSPFAPACATNNAGNGNGAPAATGGAGGDSIGGDGGNGNDVFGGTGADGASACELSGSCVNQN
jgi:hypothetical protein